MREPGIDPSGQAKVTRRTPRPAPLMAWGPLHTLGAHLAERAPDGAQLPPGSLPPKTGRQRHTLRSPSNGLFTADRTHSIMVPGTSLQEAGIIQDPGGNILRAVVL